MNTSSSYLLRCTSCGTRNRIPVTKIGSMAICGKCKNQMDTNVLTIDKPVTVTDNDFDKIVLKSPLPVLLDCWAPWCGPCRMIAPILEELAKEWKGKIRIAKLNVDENPKTAEKLQAMSIPTFFIYDAGKINDSVVGAVPKQVLVQKMSSFI